MTAGMSAGARLRGLTMHRDFRFGPQIIAIFLDEGCGTLGIRRGSQGAHFPPRPSRGGHAPALTARSTFSPCCPGVNRGDGAFGGRIDWSTAYSN